MKYTHDYITEKAKEVIKDESSVSGLARTSYSCGFIDWHNIVLWGKLSEIAEQYLKKGSKIYLEGEITYRTWEKDGLTHKITEIVASSFTMLGSNTQQKTDSYL